MRAVDREREREKRGINIMIQMCVKMDRPRKIERHFIVGRNKELRFVRRFPGFTSLSF
jgi:hypothetical protein